MQTNIESVMERSMPPADVTASGPGDKWQLAIQKRVLRFLASLQLPTVDLRAVVKHLLRKCRDWREL